MTFLPGAKLLCDILYPPPSNKHSYDLSGKFDVFVPTLLRTAPKYQIVTIITMTCYGQLQKLLQGVGDDVAVVVAVVEHNMRAEGVHKELVVEVVEVRGG